jgi:hypothetical protein
LVDILWSINQIQWYLFELLLNWNLIILFSKLCNIRCMVVRAIAEKRCSLFKLKSFLIIVLQNRWLARSSSHWVCLYKQEASLPKVHYLRFWKGCRLKLPCLWKTIKKIIVKKTNFIVLIVLFSFFYLGPLLQFDVARIILIIRMSVWLQLHWLQK